MNKRYQNYLRILFFVFIMGTISAGLLTVADFLTADIIARNQQVLRKSTILTSQEVDWTDETLDEVYESAVEELSGTLNYRGSDITIIAYRNVASGSVTMEFNKTFGAGVWGPIIGFLTVEEDLSTIQNVAILSQKETPGLGAKVKDALFLDTLIGKSMVPALRIDKTQATALDANYVASIVGATRTSVQFQNLLNATYAAYIGATWPTPLGGN